MQACDFPGSVVIGKPRDWQDDLDGDCLSIFVAPAVDTLTGMTELHSIYKPSQAEIDALQAGGVFRLTICAKTHPVFKLAVLGPVLTESIGPIPRGSLGDVIEKQ